MYILAARHFSTRELPRERQVAENARYAISRTGHRAYRRLRGVLKGGTVIAAEREAFTVVRNGIAWRDFDNMSQLTMIAVKLELDGLFTMDTCVTVAISPTRGRRPWHVAARLAANFAGLHGRIGRAVETSTTDSRRWTR